MGSAFPSARDRASGDLLTGDISTLQQTYTRTCGHNGHYTRLLCVVTGHNVTLTCHGNTVTCHDGGVTHHVLTKRARDTRRWAAMTSELHREMLTSQAPQHDWAREARNGCCTKPWTLLVRVTSRAGDKAHVTGIPLVSVLSPQLSLVWRVCGIHLCVRLRFLRSPMFLVWTWHH